MIKLRDICYVRVGTQDISAADAFAREVLGLDAVRVEAGVHYYRSDAREHTLAYFAGDPRDQVVAFELDTTEELDAAAADLSDAGLAVHAGTASTCEQRRVRALVEFRDPSGNCIELVVQPLRTARPCEPAMGSGVTGFSHVGLCSTDAQRDERFWTQCLGARVSDRIGSAALLRIDEVHHRVALFPSARAGLQHVNHQVRSIDDVMRAWYRFQNTGVRVVFGPGRHPTSGAVFLYFEGPDGLVYEYSSGVRTIPPEAEASYRPRQFPHCAESFCMWGAVPRTPQWS